MSRATCLTLWVATLLIAAVAAADEPALPQGLKHEGSSDGGAAEPALPAGLEGSGGTDGDGAEPELPQGFQESEQEPALPGGLQDGEGEPDLPDGLTADEQSPDEEGTSDGDEGWLSGTDFPPSGVHGFLEARGGIRTQSDAHQGQTSIAETRLQLETEKQVGGVTFELTADFLYDEVIDDHGIDIERGEGWIDLREASATFSPLSFVDVKVGRQILTWGTGDFLFLNDLFPKDWVSFFIGRDAEYLKTPSDAAKVSIFTDAANLDVVYTPRFDADRFIDGRRISFFDPRLGRRTGPNRLRTDRPDDWFDDGEVAARLYRRFGSYKAALYGYRGFWKSPVGFDPATGANTFPELSAYGASVRGPFAEGIGNLELSWYDSREDRGGDDPFVPNSQLRFLAGYEQEVVKNLTVGGQYYLEHRLDHNAYVRTLPPRFPAAEENRHVVTGRLTWLTFSQNVEWSLFAFWSPSDADAYLRPRVHYKVTDALGVEVGANVFLAEEPHTFFGQFERNSNVYAAIRYSF